MHGEHAHLGQDVVHDGEHGLLDLTGVLGTGDDHLVGLIVHQDRGLAAGTVDLGDALEAGSGNDGEVLVEIGQLLGGGTAQQLMDEQILAGQFVDDAEGLGVLGIGAGKAVKNEYFLALQVSGDLGADGIVALQVDGTVDLAPGDVVVNSGSINDEFVVGAAAGVLTGLDHQSTRQRQGSLTAAKSVFRQLSGVQVPINGLRVDDAQLFQSVGFHACFPPIVIKIVYANISLHYFVL